MHDLLIAPEASLVSQSVKAREAKTVVNGDGCGLGWYGERNQPGLFRDTRPAWSDANFASLCAQIRSPLFMAHVRSATAGEVAQANCHPFAHGRHLFMHNGQIGGFCQIKRKLEALIADDIYPFRQGTTDSEVIFLIAASLGLRHDPVLAMEKALRLCLDDMHAAGLDAALRFSAALADGEKLYAFRWSSDPKPPSLYWCRLEKGLAISSEPFSFDTSPWHEVPPATVLVADKGAMELRPFMAAEAQMISSSSATVAA